MTSSTSALFAAIAAALGGSGAPSLSSPLELERNSCVGANLYRASATQNAFTSASAFTGAADSINRIPGSVQIDSDWTNGVWKDILSSSRRVGLFNFIGPTLATAGQILTLGITKDGGTEVEIPIEAQANASRCILGPTKREGDVVTAAVYKGIELGGTSSDGITNWLTGNQTIVNPSDLLRDGFVPFRCSTSIVIRAKINADLSTTTNQERRCAAIVRNFS